MYYEKLLLYIFDSAFLCCFCSRVSGDPGFAVTRDEMEDVLGEMLNVLDTCKNNFFTA